MSRFLFAPMPFTGHVNPGLPIARELVARGHDVRWYATLRFKAAIEATGARFVPYRKAMKLEEGNLDIMFPDRPASGLAQMRYDVKKVFVEVLAGQFDDLLDELGREPADVIVGDTSAGVCQAIKQKLGTPWAIYGVMPLTMPSRDTAPFGMALMPDASLLGRLRNRLLYWVHDRVLFREANVFNDVMRRGMGLPPLGRSIFDVGREADLILQGTVPSFEYPRTDMPPQLRWIGASIPQPPAGWKEPSWWHELDGGKRVVLVTQGTINNEYDQLIRPAIRALANEDVLVVVTTGSRPAEDVGITPLPRNVRVARFIPYKLLMPKVDLLLTNGGYGSVQIALAAGVPVAAFGKTEEKPEIANRIKWAGVGIGVKSNAPTEAKIREVVSTVLENPRFRARAEAIAYEMSGFDAPKRAAELLEGLGGGVEACELRSA